MGLLGWYHPVSQVSPWAIEVMKEVCVDIRHHVPTPVDTYLQEEWDYVVTVCDYAHEACPAFSGKVKHRIHMGLEDPANVVGSEEQILNKFRQVWDQIKEYFWNLYNEYLKNS
ncbi:MAG: arsenate reductase ArsC [Bacteroidales bacterium]